MSAELFQWIRQQPLEKRQQMLSLFVEVMRQAQTFDDGSKKKKT